MARYKFIVLANAVAGQETEFNDFYSDTHVPDVLDVPGIKTAQRFVISSGQFAPTPSPYKYLAIYDVEAENAEAVCAEILRRSGTDAMPINPHIVQDPKFAYFFEPIEDMRTPDDI